MCLAHQYREHSDIICFCTGSRVARIHRVCLELQILHHGLWIVYMLFIYRLINEWK